MATDEIEQKLRAAILQAQAEGLTIRDKAPGVARSWSNKIYKPTADHACCVLGALVLGAADPEDEGIYAIAARLLDVGPLFVQGLYAGFDNWSAEDLAVYPASSSPDPAAIVIGRKLRQEFIHE